MNTYLNSENKKRVREFLVSKFKFKSVIGLAGPDINEYIKCMEDKGCNEFQLYENNPSTFVNQIANLKRSGNITLKYEDIISAPFPYKKDVLYDLDFCTSALHMRDYIKKFRDKFIMTFSLRPYGTISTISKFFESRNEAILLKKEYKIPLLHTIFTTNKGKYIYVSYRDNTPMCCIAKIN